MLQHEYNARLEAERSKRDKRSWTVTIVSALLSLLPVAGIFSVWRHALADNSLFFTIVVPLACMVAILVVIALDGRPRSIVEMLRNIPGPWLY